MAISTAQKVVDVAMKYLGCTQGSAKQKQLIKIFNSVKPHGYTANWRDPWCAEAWSAWQIEAGNTAKSVPLSANCAQLIEDAKALGIWIEKDSAVPEIGWGILYDWDDSGKGDNRGAPDHVGLIYAVDKKWIYVIEGNKGSESVCGKRAVQIDGKFIRGFVAPKYKTEKAYKPEGPYKGKLPKTTVKYGTDGPDVKKVKAFLKWYQDADLNPKNDKCRSKTVAEIKKFEKSQGIKADGIFGPVTLGKAKEVVRKYEPKDPLVERILDACKVQAEWMKNYVYGWQAKPTIPKSKRKGTCVTYEACVLQRLGYLKPGECIWHDSKGKVYGTNDRMLVKYIKKTLRSLKGSEELKAGDIIIAGDPKSVEAGGRSHICTFTGKWDKNGNPYVWDNRSADRVKKGKSGPHTYSGSNKTIAIIRLKNEE